MSLNNGKREYAKNGLEQDVLSHWARKYLSYLHNVKGIKKFAKRCMNRRFRHNKEYKKDLDIWK